MSQTTPDPITGDNDPFRSDDEERDRTRTDDDSVGVGIPILLGDDQAQDRADVDEPGDRA
ncbi:hypothetical protein [Cellulomonas sp. URHE0023]|uniref:hypothetical protein n=1 Tax=Cellulomonas sp. URHE0023 TaxID=1380354 RepID=UPI000AB7F50D|nr:hypothetical protein [Cellulomonas sp. URHE0023]